MNPDIHSILRSIWALNALERRRSQENPYVLSETDRPALERLITGEARMLGASLFPLVEAVNTAPLEFVLSSEAADMTHSRSLTALAAIEEILALRTLERMAFADESPSASRWSVLAEERIAALRSLLTPKIPRSASPCRY